MLEYGPANRRSSGQLSRRQLAFAFDTVVWHCLGLLYLKGTGLIDYLWNNFSLTGYTVLSIFVLLGWRLVFLMKDGIFGYSPGKWIMDLRVITNTGNPIGPFTSIKRNLLLIVPIIGEIVIWTQMRLGRRWFDQSSGSGAFVFDLIHPFVLLMYAFLS